jgi:hypothetical protein
MPVTHAADEIVPDGPFKGMTRLEASEQERRQAIRAEFEQHRANTDQELGRHKQAMDTITIAFSMSMWIA